MNFFLNQNRLDEKIKENPAQYEILRAKIRIGCGHLDIPEREEDCIRNISSMLAQKEDSAGIDNFSRGVTSSKAIELAASTLEKPKEAEKNDEELK